MPEDVKLIDIDRLDRNNDKLVDKLTIQVDTMPVPSATYAGKTVQFIGSSAQYDTGKFYKCVNNGNDNYIWRRVAVESKEIKYTQYETLPTAAQSNVGQIAQYIGNTTNDYKNGHFYKCTGYLTGTGDVAVVNGVIQYDTFSWEPVTVQDTDGFDTTCTLTVAGWTGNSAPYTQTVNVANILSTDRAWVDLSVSSTVSTGLDQIDDWTLISKIESGAGTLTFSCYEDKPTVELTANVKVVR